MGRAGIALVLAFVASVACRPEPGPVALIPEDPDLRALAWMTGSWVRTEPGARIEEHWTAPAGASMLGMNRNVVGGRTAFFEFLRIEFVEGSIRYAASPMGRDPPTVFELAAIEPGRVEFANPEHDFPTRVGYARQGSTLVAWIAGEEAGQAKEVRWVYQRARLVDVPPEALE